MHVHSICTCRVVCTCTLRGSQLYLLHVSKQHLHITNNIVKEYIEELVLTVLELLKIQWKCWKTKRINKTSEARCFDTYDFATLYTSITHDMLKSSIRTLVREAYKVRGAKYLVIDRLNRAQWSEVPSSVTTCMNVDKSKLINWMEYLIH